MFKKLVGCGLVGRDKLVGRDDKSGRDGKSGRFCNPVTYGMFALLFAVVFMSGCASTGATSGNNSLKGMVAQPVKGAYLFVYQSGMDPHGPPFTMSEATGEDGSFEIDDLPDGEYTVVARKHASGLPGSPLSEGDQKSEMATIKVAGGKILSQTIFLGTKDDKEQYFGASEETKTAIAGKVMDSEGNPMKGFRVHVYTYAQMSERPKYVSAATGPDGKYIVYMPKGGTYYISARDHFGGPPKIGDYYGRYDEGTIDPSGVIVKTGSELDNINITVHKVW